MLQGRLADVEQQLNSAKMESKTQKAGSRKKSKPAEAQIPPTPEAQATPRNSESSTKPQEQPKLEYASMAVLNQSTNCSDAAVA